jgi:hypothetical protein
MKKTKYNTVESIPGTSIKSGRIKLFYGPNPSLLVK